MSRVVVALFVLVSLSFPAHAARRAAAKGTGRTADTVRREVGNPILLQVGPGLVSGAYSVGVSLNAGAVVRASSNQPIYVGVDTMLTLGTNYYSYYDSYYTGGGGIGLGLLATGFYRFTFPRRQNLHIIGGVSTGPFIGGGRVGLAILVRPGFTYDFSPTISVTGEPLTGVITPGFVFMPRAIFTFKI